MGDEVRVTVIAAGFDRWDDNRRTHDEEPGLSFLHGEDDDAARDVFGGDDDDDDDLDIGRRRLRRPVVPEVIHAALDHLLTDGRTARVRFTGSADGDLRIGGEPTELARRRADLVDPRGPGCARCTAPASSSCARLGAGAGERGRRGRHHAHRAAVLAVHTADCAPVVLGGRRRRRRRGPRRLAGPGRRGRGRRRRRSWRPWPPGPCGPCRAAASAPSATSSAPTDLDRVAERLGHGVASRTARGHAGPRPARRRPGRAGVPPAWTRSTVIGGCTACDPTRARTGPGPTTGRQAVRGLARARRHDHRRDQVRAGLSAVRARIEAAGGDPERITRRGRHQGLRGRRGRGRAGRGR